MTSQEISGNGKELPYHCLSLNTKGKELLMFTYLVLSDNCEKATDDFLSLLSILLSHCIMLFVTIRSITITNTLYYYNHRNPNIPQPDILCGLTFKTSLKSLILSVTSPK